MRTLYLATILLILMALPGLFAAPEKGACYSNGSSRSPSARLGERHDGTIDFCLQSSISYCFRFDEKSRIFRDVDFPSHVEEKEIFNYTYRPPLKPAFTTSWKGRDLTVCVAGQCSTLTVTAGPQDPDNAEVELSEDHSLLLIRLEPGPIAYEMYDFKKKALLYAKPYNDLLKPLNLPEDYFSQGRNFSEFRFAGPAVYMNYYPCIRSCNFGFLLDARTGRFISRVGTEAVGLFFTLHTEPVRVSGDQYAFLEGNSGRLVIQNVRTGKIMETHDLTPYVPREVQYSPSDNWPEIASSLLFVTPDSYIIVFGAGVPGRIVQFSRKDFKPVSDTRMRECTGP